MSHLILLAAGSLAFAAAPAPAQTTNDVQCLLVSNFFAKVGKEEQARRRAEAALYYYLGRTAERFNDAQLKAALDAEQKALRRLKVGSVMAACSQTMSGSVNRLRTWNRQPAAKGKRREG